MAEERILTRHPLRKSGRNISKAKYEATRRALVGALRRRELTHGELMRAIAERLADGFEGNVAWYAETVKLDLEARKIIERTGSRPQRYRLT